MPVSTQRPEEGVGSFEAGDAGIGGSPGFSQECWDLNLHFRVVRLLLLTAESSPQSPTLFFY